MSEPTHAHKVFSWPVRVYWEDTDAGGIVFYANYLRYFERARTEWLRALGFDQSVLRQAHGGMFVVSEANLRYRSWIEAKRKYIFDKSEGKIG